LILDRNRGGKNSHLIDRETRLGTYVSDDLCELAHTRSALRAISIPQGLIFGMGAAQVTSSRKGARGVKLGNPEQDRSRREVGSSIRRPRRAWRSPAL
jgi:hypothetical protein